MTLSTTSIESKNVAVIGGGLAGIAAAAALVENGMKVTLFEARSQLGGRSTSYIDSESGAVIDNCQHVSMGCCTNLRHLCQWLQIEDAFQTEDRLFFISPQGQCTTFSADPLPAPLHLSRAFRRLPYLTFRDQLRFARAVRKLARASSDSLRGQSFQDWLVQNRQPDHLIRNVWDVVLVSALSESLERIDAAYARKVFVDGFLKNTQGWKIEVPRVSLDELYSTRALASLQSRGVDVQTQSRCEELVFDNEGKLFAARFRDGRQVAADEFILAVPHHQFGVLTGCQSALLPLVKQLEQMETSPITSVHLWFDREVTDLPHAVFVDRLSQWMFSRGISNTPSGTGHLYQVVISASRRLQGRSQEDVVTTVRDELASVWPSAAEVKLLHHRMITERRAVFSATPGIDRLRPFQQTAVENLQAAGDWTQTGWPATMEGAVRSGYLAAGNILHRHSIPASPLQPDLPCGWLSRWLLGLRS